MTDAGYLKRYQLACRREFNPVRLDYQYDTLMLDEAQDAAPVMADIILSQKECGKILVGDPHQ
jgi:F-box protein 18 (helicase)